MPTPPRAHTGAFEYHDDDCRCALFNDYCCRDGYVWSCCGAGQEDSSCSAPSMHPTHWRHGGHNKTVLRYTSSHKPVYRPDAEIRALFPDSFR